MKVSFLYPLVAFTLSVFATSFIYSTFVIPSLPTVQSVPTFWWIGCALPIILVAFYLGWVAKSIVSVFKVSAVGLVSYLVFLQLNGQNLHGIVDGSTHHYMQLLITSCLVFIGILILVSLGYILSIVWRSKFA